MLPNAFIGKPIEPTEDELTAELGSARMLWDQLVSTFEKECGIVVREWTSYSRKAGWALPLKVKKRNILYLSPHHSSFSASLVLGNKAVEAARQSALPKKVIQIVEEGKRYPEGTAVRMDVTGAEDIAAIVRLASIKLQY